MSKLTQFKRSTTAGVQKMVPGSQRDNLPPAPSPSIRDSWSIPLPPTPDGPSPIELPQFFSGGEEALTSTTYVSKPIPEWIKNDQIVATLLGFVDSDCKFPSPSILNDFLSRFTTFSFGAPINYRNR